MERKWSEGPWGITGPDEFGDFTIHESEIPLAIAAVCNGDIRGLVNKTSEHVANAHLIASAPELYEALEACLDELMTVYHSEFDGVWAATDFAKAEAPYKAALAKARGE